MPLGRIDEETTANIGRFEGGGATNIVPEKAFIYAEARSLVDEKLNEQVNKMKTAFQETAEAMGAQAEVTIEKMYPAFKFTEEDKIVQIAAAAAKKIGRESRLIKSGGGSDANIINGYGIPTVVLGVGYEGIHTTKERMPIKELNKIVEMVIAIIEVVNSN